MRQVWPKIKIDSVASDIVATTADLKELYGILRKSQDSKNKIQLHDLSQSVNECQITTFDISDENKNTFIEEVSLVERDFANTFLSKSLNRVFSSQEFVSRHQDEFIDMIKNCHLEVDGYDNLVARFNELLKEDKNGTQKLISDVFSETLIKDVPDVELQVRILKLLALLPYESLDTAAALIASSAYSLKNIRVKSAVCDVFGHWANRYAYNLLKQMESPREAWLLMKYDALIQQLKEKYDIPTEN